MNPGRELDALVAEKVMGWKTWKSKHGHWELGTPGGKPISTFGRRDSSVRYDSVSGKRVREVLWWEDLYEDELPSYSTSIAAAWEVFEWLCKRGDDIAEVVQLTFNVQNGWWCTSERWTQIDVQGNAPTAPLAICLAALKAVGVEIPAEPTSGDITLTHSSDVLV